MGESDGAWELGEAEGMIVGAVRQEDECSWSDACDTWTALDEETEVGIHQVEADEAGTSEDDQEEGLLIEGEEREYVLELLLRETSLVAQASNQPDSSKPASSKSKRKRDLGKKHHKRARVVKEAVNKAPQRSGGKATGGGEVKHVPRGQPCSPETWGERAATGRRGEGNQPAPPPPTLGRVYGDVYLYHDTHLHPSKFFFSYVCIT